MDIDGKNFTLKGSILSLCVMVLQANAVSVWDEMRDNQNAIQGKVSRIQINVSTVDFDLTSKGGLKKRYQLCKSDLRGRSPSVALLQSAFQSKETVEVLPSDAFNSCIDGIAIVTQGEKR